MFQKTEASQRQYCKKYGGHLMTNHPPLGLVDVFAATLPTLKFSLAVHINYAETVLPPQAEGFSERVRRLRGSGAQIANWAKEKSRRFALARASPLFGIRN
jgi:hypothetical protein